MLVTMKYPELLKKLEAAAKLAAYTDNNLDNVEVGVELDTESYVQPLGGVIVRGYNLITVHLGPHYGGGK